MVGKIKSDVFAYAESGGSEAEVNRILATASAKCKIKALYGKGAHSFELLSLINPSLIVQASPWAKRFIDELARRKT